MLECAAFVPVVAPVVVVVVVVVLEPEVTGRIEIGIAGRLRMLAKIITENNVRLKKIIFKNLNR